MRLLFVTEFYSPDNQDFTGGVEARTHHLVKRLKKTHQVKVISRPKNHIAASPLSIFDRLLFQLSAVIDSLRIPADVVEGSNFVSFLPAFLVAWLKQVPSVAWFADVYGQTWFKTMSLPVAITGYCMEWLALKLPWSQIIAMSESTQQKLIKAGVSKDKITVVYGGVDLQAIERTKVEQFTSPTIITATRLVNYKRVGDLIEAFAQVKQSIPKAKLIICGEGPERTSLELRAKSLGLSFNSQFSILNFQTDIIFSGNIAQQQVHQLMKQSHVFCLPSAVEGFGLVTIEAMACGLPYINADIPVTREITDNGQGGLLFPVGDVTSLAQQITKLLTNKSVYTQKVKEAKALVSKYDWSTITKQTEQIFENIK